MNSFGKSEAAGSRFSRMVLEDMEYDFEAYLINPESRFFILRPAAILDLVIEDNINNYYHQGYAVLDNRMDLLERVADEGGPSFLFRGEGRDIFRFKFTPKLTPGKNINENEGKVKELISLDFDFVIYNVEEYVEEGQKKRKIFFHDLYKQILSETNGGFSTGTYSNLSISSDDDTRSLNTGIAIRELLREVFPSTDGFGVSFADFDEGGTKIFFSAPSSYSGDDCLNYLLSKHVSTKDNNNDRCILRIERYPKRWSLVSLSKFFKNAYRQQNDAGGSLFLENFLLQGFKGGSGSKVLNVVIKRTPSVASYIPRSGIISQFNYIPPAAANQNAITSSLVHSYSYSGKSFSIDAKDNTFDSVQTIFQDNYVKNLKGDKGKPISNLYGNLTRKEQKNTRNVYSTSNYSPEQRLGVGRSNVLKNAILMNSCINFSIEGATYRQACRFIGIDRNDDAPASSIDDKMLGIYFIVSVRHIIRDNKYMNDIVAVKVYDYKDIGFKGEYV